MSLEGLNAHECGHNLFTDERIWHSYFAGLAKGKFYPKMPDGLDSMQKLYAKDILEALTDDTDTVPMQVIMKVYNWLDKLASEEQGFYVVMNFLRILYELSLYDNARVLSSSSFAKIETFSDSRRVQKVQKYISTHYQEDIRLASLADMVGMTPVSFSRFFRLRTGKTLSDYIIDIRLGFATRMLVDSTRTIAEVCYDCGFNNLSNFNRMFKRKKGCSPKEFRENYRKKKLVI